MSSHKPFTIPIEIVPRHVHLSPAHWRVLFGKGAHGHERAHLSQRGQVVFRETVRVIGPKGVMDHVFVFGPCRRDTQVELSKTDAAAIGLDAPERVSGDLRASAGCRLVGAEGELTLRRGVIVPVPHVHLSDRTAHTYGLRQGDIIDVDVVTDTSFVFPQVVVRVHPTFESTFHISSDEAARFWIPRDSFARLRLAS